MAKNVNTTAKRPTDADAARELATQFERTKRMFAESPRVDIMLPELENSTDQTLEGGINGYFFTLMRGVKIEDCPMPIVKTLERAGIFVSKLSAVKAPKKPEAPVTKKDVNGKPPDGSDPAVQ